MIFKLNFAYLSGTFVNSLFLGLAFSVYFQNRRSLVNQLFALYLTSIYLFVVLSYFYIGVGLIPPILMPIQMSFTAFAPPLFFLFSRVFARNEDKLKKWDFLVFIPALYITLVNILRLSIPSLYQRLLDTVRVENFRLYRESDIHYLIYTAYQLLGHIGGMVLLFQGMIREKNLQNKKPIRAVFFAVLFGYLGIFIFVNLFTILGIPDDGTLSILPIVICLFFISFTIMRHKAWKIESLLDLIRKREQELAERNQTIENELDMARLIQAKLLPVKMPSVPVIELATLYQPMDKVGGDYYDLYPAGNTLNLFIADVSGHGIPGAFIASITKMAFQFYVDAADDCAEMMSALDHTLSERSVKSLYVTAVFARYDTKSRMLSYVNAGHLNPLLQRKSPQMEFIELKSRGAPLGIGLEQNFEEKSIQLYPRDRLFLYTDGLIEITDSEGKMWNDTGFCSFAEKNADLAPSLFSQRLFDHLCSIKPSNEWADDVTLIIMDIQ